MVREAGFTYSSLCSDLTKFPVPRQLPDVLKQFTKAAIKTHPSDLLIWASAYFAALADGERPLVKERLELAEKVNLKWITLGLLRLLHRQIQQPEVSLIELWTLWKALSLDQDKLERCLEEGQFKDSINWIQLLAVICRDVSANMASALRLFCEVVTEEPEGYSAKVPLQCFLDCYEFLLRINPNELSSEQKDAVVEYLQNCAESQNGMVHPGNFWSNGSPRLE